MTEFKELLIIALDTKPVELFLLIFLLSAFITMFILYIANKNFRGIVDGWLFEEEEVIELTLTKEEWEKLKKSINNVA